MQAVLRFPIPMCDPCGDADTEHSEEQHLPHYEAVQLFLSEFVEHGHIHISTRTPIPIETTVAPTIHLSDIGWAPPP